MECDGSVSYDEKSTLLHMQWRTILATFNNSVSERMLDDRKLCKATLITVQNSTK